MKLDLSKDFDSKRADTYFQKLKKDGARIELKKVPEPKTVRQFNYLHVCLMFFCRETGYSITEAKDMFAQMLPEMMYYEKNGYKFRRSTNDLDTKEATTLIDLVREICNNELGCYVPTADEYLMNKFGIDRELGI